MSDKELKENLQDEEKVEVSEQNIEGDNTASKESDEADTKSNEDTQEQKSDETVESSESEDNNHDDSVQDTQTEDETVEEESVAQSTPNTPIEKVEHARNLVESADSEVNECIATVKKDIDEFEEYEQESLAPIINESRKLLDRLGIDSEDIGELPHVNADISAVESSEKLYVNDLPSGKGGAFIWGLIGGLATLAGWCAFAAKEAGLPIPPQSLDMATVEKLSAKLSEVIGFGTNAQAGLGIAVASAILVFIIIFSIKVSLQSSKNEELAKEIEEKAQEYKSEKEQCKLNLKKIDEHLRELRDVALKYEVLLDEKNAAIRRAIRIEGVATLDDMHESSKKEVEHLMTLIREIERLIEAPIVENGALSQHSANLLRDTKILLQKHIDNIYA